MKALLSLLAILVFATSHAQEPGDTLGRIKKSGEIRIGFVPDAPPLSFHDENDNAIGYSIDLCRRIALAARDAVGLEQIRILFVPLTRMEDRIRAIEDGDIDIECGATTVTMSRRERVDFTLMTFITGSAVLSLKSSPVDTVDDLHGVEIAVLRDTTTEGVMRKVIEINEFDIDLRLIGSHDEGMRLLNEGKVKGYASDRAMLIGQVFRHAGADNQYAMTRNALSYEPYAFMVQRGDSAFRLVADKALAEQFRGAGIRRLYQTWFGRYGEPLSPIVAAMYEFQAVGE